jgi:hypothetical protein
MIKQLRAEGRTKEQIRRVYRDLGFTDDVFEFIWAMETGAIIGDNIVVDEDGSEHLPASDSLKRG